MLVFILIWTFFPERLNKNILKVKSALYIFVI